MVSGIAARALARAARHWFLRVAKCGALAKAKRLEGRRYVHMNVKTLLQEHKHQTALQRRTGLPQDTK